MRGRNIEWKLKKRRNRTKVHQVRITKRYNDSQLDSSVIFMWTPPRYSFGSTPPRYSLGLFRDIHLDSSAIFIWTPPWYHLDSSTIFNSSLDFCNSSSWTDLSRVFCVLGKNNIVLGNNNNNGASYYKKGKIYKACVQSVLTYRTDEESKSANSLEDGTDDGEMDVRGVAEG